MTSAAAFAFAATMPAYAAAGTDVVRVSDDPFTNAASQHRSEVEPDTFSFGATWVSAFQVGRIFDGGASDIGWATSIDAGQHFVHGFLPGVTPFTTPAGAYDRASDASVAFDLRHHTWLISYLAIHNLPTGGTGVVDVLASRSPDGVNWGMPVPVATLNTFLDKNWTVCDNSAISPHFGNCYTEFDIASQRDLEQMSTSTDGGLTWGASQPTADAAHGLGGQPVVQPSGRVVVPYEGVGAARGERAFTSNDGGATWTASVQISTITARRSVNGAIRTSPLPTAEVDALGRVYVAWQDCRFETACANNDVVFSTSDDGTTWSPVQRIPIDPVGSNVDHIIPGLAVDPITFGDHARLALTYYFFPAANCTVATCQLEVGFVTSRNSGASWSAPETLAGPMSLSWLPITTQGVMVADYISTSFVAGIHARPAFEVANAPSASGTLDQATFSAQEAVLGGDVQTADDAVVLFPGSGLPIVDEGGDDDDNGV
ncbi:MAG TPA: sialidase family protein [Candidatus Dormibacteraeota bacterium]|nr:sialidase family protein [Candidatus Dormibacteraeota bacterium]